MNDAPALFLAIQHTRHLYDTEGVPVPIGATDAAKIYGVSPAAVIHEVGKIFEACNAARVWLARREHVRPASQAPRPRGRPRKADTPKTLERARAELDELFREFAARG